MRSSVNYQPKTNEIPTNPGVYRFFSSQGQVIYVGKAKNLRARLSSYFQDPDKLHPRTRQMVHSAQAVQWTVVASELEALNLEYTWIKEFNPRFNVMFKDDKSYPYLAVSLQEEIPRVWVMRGARSRDIKYFGPYSQVGALRDTLDQLQRVFQIRTCTSGVLKRAQKQGRPCLLGYIDRCAGPCVAKSVVDSHRENIQNLCDFMSGKTISLVKEIKAKMLEASQEQNYELAAKYRDNLRSLEKVLAQNTVVLSDDTDADVFGLYVDELEASIQVFHVRSGRIRGQRGWISARNDDADDAQLMRIALEQIYTQTRDRSKKKSHSSKYRPSSVDDNWHWDIDTVAKDILVSVLPDDVSTLRQWIGEKRGAKVNIRTPQRGDKSKLMETVKENAKSALTLHRMRRSTDLTQRTLALNELAQYLGLERGPLRIECYDISHTQGKAQMGSMVVFEDGSPRKDAYRVFGVKGEAGEGVKDDTAAMREVLKRRFTNLLAEEQVAQPVTKGEISIQNLVGEERKRFSYRPELVVVDGGLPQVNAAKTALHEAGVPEIPVISLAKRLEEVWIPGEEFPMIFSRNSPALYLLQYLRDESHRFAIKAHRKKRSKAMTVSVLDKIPGLGPAKQKNLIRYFKSVQNLRQASIEELQEVSGIGPVLAGQVLDYLHKHP